MIRGVQADSHWGQGVVLGGTPPTVQLDAVPGETADGVALRPTLRGTPRWTDACKFSDQMQVCKLRPGKGCYAC